MVGTWAAIERDGTQIFGVDQDNDSWGRWDPTMDVGGTLPIVPMGFNSTGSDVALSGGTWYYFANTGTQLRAFDGAMWNQVGSPVTGAAFMSGMVGSGDGSLWAHSGDSNELYELNKTTGQIIQTVPLCLACPTVYDVQSGDMARAQ